MARLVTFTKLHFLTEGELLQEIMNGQPGKYRSKCRRKLVLNLAIDLLKGSYYANPIVDNAVASPEERAAYPEYYGRNICKPMSGRMFWIFPERTRAGWEWYPRLRRGFQRPREVSVYSPYLAEEFPEWRLACRFVFKVGCELAIACQPFGNDFDGASVNDTNGS